VRLPRPSIAVRHEGMRKLVAPIAGCSSRSALPITIACLVIASCEQSVRYQVGQPIEMGPYSFSVTSPARGRSWQSAEGPYYEIEVRFRLDRDDTAPFTTDFNESFLDAMRIVDAAGNAFGCSPGAVDGSYRAGRYRSDQYRCLIRYSQSSDGVTDFAKVGTKPADFQLIIINPEPRDGQPRRVIVQLK
jgi:hypothetical protein